MRLARVGLERVSGHLERGLLSWQEDGREIATLDQWPVDELRAQIAERGAELQVIDVRRPGEYRAGHVPGARSLPLDRLEAEAASLDRSRPLAVVCQSGYRSSTACSVLQRHGFTDLVNVAGGTAAWVAAGHPSETS
jgi:hydroxyacylglutathione hydrolase